MNAWIENQIYVISTQTAVTLKEITHVRVQKVSVEMVSSVKVNYSILRFIIVLFSLSFKSLLQLLVKI